MEHGEVGSVHYGPCRIYLVRLLEDNSQSPVSVVLERAVENLIATKVVARGKEDAMTNADRQRNNLAVRSPNVNKRKRLNEISAGKNVTTTLNKISSTTSSELAPLLDSDVSMAHVRHRQQQLGSAEPCRRPVTVILQNTELLLDRSHRRRGDSGITKLCHADMTDQSSAVARPDLTHHVRPLNKQGALDIYLENVDGKVIYVNPEFRIPRTWKVFAKVLTDFLSHPRGVLCAPESDIPLLKQLEPPLSSHLVGSSPLAPFTHLVFHPTKGRFCRLRTILPRVLVPNTQRVFVTVQLPTDRQSRAQGLPKDGSNGSGTTHYLRVSHYPVSSTVICNRLCNELEIALETRGSARSIECS